MNKNIVNSSISTGDDNNINNKQDSLVSANSAYKKKLNDKDGRFTTYKKAIKGSLFLGSLLQNKDEKLQISLIDAETDAIVTQISARTGLEFATIADTMLVEDFSYIDKNGKLKTSFSSANLDDMRFVFASALTRLSSIIKRQVHGRGSAAKIITILDVNWSAYKVFKTSELSIGTDAFASYLPEDIRKVM